MDNPILIVAMSDCKNLPMKRKNSVQTSVTFVRFVLQYHFLIWTSGCVGDFVKTILI